MSKLDPAEIATKYGYSIHPACELLPLMDDDALNRLAGNIHDNGLTNPIITHEGQIVDGRNRLIACGLAGVEPHFQLWQAVYKGPLTLCGWILAQNIQRRHLTDDQVIAATVALRAYEEQDLAKHRQAEGQKRGGEVAGKGRPKPDSIPTNSPGCYTATGTGPVIEPPSEAPCPDVRAKLAAETGVSEYKTQQALTVQKKKPELLRDVVRGETKLREAFQQVHSPNPGKRKTVGLTSTADPDLAAPSNRAKAADSSGKISPDGAIGLHSFQDAAASNQDASDGLASAEMHADRMIQGVRLVLNCLPHKAAVTAYLRAHGGLTVPELGAAVEFLNDFKPVLMEYTNGLDGAGDEVRTSAAAGYALPQPAEDATRTDTAGSNETPGSSETAGLDNFHL